MHGRTRNVYIASLVLFAVPIVGYNTMPLYLVPLSQAVGSTIGKVQLLLTFVGFASMAASLLLGQLLDRLGAKLLSAIGSVALAGFFFSIYFTDSLALAYAGGISFGFAVIAAGSGVAMTEVNWWFSKGAGKLMSFLTIGAGVATMVFSPVIAKGIETYGARDTALVQGIIMGAVCLLTNFFLLSERPERYGIQIHASDISESAARDVGGSLPLKAILSTSAFWLVMIAIVLALFALTGFMNNAPAFYQTIGLNAVQASIGISVFSVGQLIWTPVYGSMLDKFGVRVATALCTIPAIVIFAAATMMKGFVSAMIIAALFASINFFAVVLGPVLYPMIFGKKEAASLVGFANAGSSIGAMAGAPAAGFIYDYFKSYNPFLFLSSALCIVSLFLVFLATSKGVMGRIQAMRAVKD